LGNAVSSFLVPRKYNTTIRHPNARKYLSPAKVRGGKLCKPTLINTQDVAHRNTTNKAWKTAAKWEFILKFPLPTNQQVIVTGKLRRADEMEKTIERPVKDAPRATLLLRALPG
jgi:hypothetical protein